MAPSVFVDRDNDLDPVKAARYGMEAAYFDVRDAKIKDRLAFALKHVPKVGVYICSQGDGWQPLGDGTSWADYASKLLATCDLGAPDRPMVCLNCEQHDAPALLAMLKRWRAHRQKRATAWCMEGHQGGWMTRSLAYYCANEDISCWPQAYEGSMVRTESDRVALEMVMAGFPASSVNCVYSGADLGAWFDGAVFTQGSLP